LCLLCRTLGLALEHTSWKLMQLENICLLETSTTYQGVCIQLLVPNFTFFSKWGLAQHRRSCFYKSRCVNRWIFFLLLCQRTYLLASFFFFGHFSFIAIIFYKP
jgi:hypothetical protein